MYIYEKFLIYELMDILWLACLGYYQQSAMNIGVCISFWIVVLFHIYTYTRNAICEVKPLSRVQLFAAPWTVAHQAPPSMEFFRQEYWSGLPFPSPGDLPNPGIEPRSPTLQADALTSEPCKSSEHLYLCL